MELDVFTSTFNILEQLVLESGEAPPSPIPYRYHHVLAEPTEHQFIRFTA
ncbi:hypothetical protein TRAPUB_10179 [Trametes pubescens]|uniref:Uncharacterized protein n=1 Tax=Trametes pubescens TaxID=154538 RepID=A0A1M2W0G7_TRAPU|nr:hypothetical protein TRAPUB_10179 [Trametes pubescens]